jgi:hypothetical protein
MIYKDVWSPEAIICCWSIVMYMHLCNLEYTPYSHQGSTQLLPFLIEQPDNQSDQ